MSCSGTHWVASGFFSWAGHRMKSSALHRDGSMLAQDIVLTSSLMAGTQSPFQCIPNEWLASSVATHPRQHFHPPKTAPSTTCIGRAACDTNRLSQASPTIGDRSVERVLTHIFYISSYFPPSSSGGSDGQDPAFNGQTGTATHRRAHRREKYRVQAWREPKL